LDILLEAVKGENTVGQIQVLMLQSEAMMVGILLEAALVLEPWDFAGEEMAALVLEVEQAKDKAVTAIRAVEMAAMALY
tara:strand:- start:209 stop:445 length:237 start_codon:yes stop_codon:yes gene_type:complete